MGISVLAVAMAFVAGAANAQVAYMSQNEFIVETAGGQTAKMHYGGDLLLGGNGWTGEIWLYDSSGNTDGYWVSSTLTLGGLNDDGDIYLRDSVNTSNTIHLDGQYGQITLGNSASTEDGDLTILDNDGTQSIFLDGASGTINNQLGGNGLIKAWARINSDGTVASCWRCNTNVLETRRIATGQYEVDFTFTTDITTRPMSATVDSHTAGSVWYGDVNIGYRSGDTSSAWVITRYEDANYDRPFTIFVF